MLLYDESVGANAGEKRVVFHVVSRVKLWDYSREENHTEQSCQSPVRKRLVKYPVNTGNTVSSYLYSKHTLRSCEPNETRCNNNTKT